MDIDKIITLMSYILASGGVVGGALMYYLNRRKHLEETISIRIDSLSRIISSQAESIEILTERIAKLEQENIELKNKLSENNEKIRNYNELEVKVESLKSMIIEMIVLLRKYIIDNDTSQKDKIIGLIEKIETIIEE